MWRYFAVTCLVVIAASSYALGLELFDDADTDEQDMEDAYQIIKLINKPRRIQSDATFSYSDCSQSSDPAHTVSLSIGPDPIGLPGNVTLAFHAHVNSDLPSKVSLDLEIKKKIGFFWIEAPCIKQKGSCHYDDICAALAQITCPSTFKQYNIPCQCPVKQGDYNLPASTFFANVQGVPSGQYQIRASFKQGPSEISCIYMQLSVR